MPRLFHLFVLTLFISASTYAAAPRIDVILWFDTEDYLLPASDDAAKRLAEMLTERNIRATFKVVGEKARTLERRGRKDVIQALQKHDIGFHSDFHSVHPTPTEYLADCGWLDGIAEFARREGDGAADVRRIFGVPTLACYGQPGSSWAPQTLGGLKRIGVAPHGVPCYVDEGNDVGLNEKPFWYVGVLNVFHMGGNYTRMDLHDANAPAPAKKKVSEIVERLRGDGGGLISIFYHPCEWVHQQFWDGVNFARGANPPRSEWKAPPQRTAEETEGAFRRFAEYIDYIKAIDGVRFIVASDLPDIYPDHALMEGVTKAELDELAKQVLKTSASGLTFATIGHKSFSIADQFEVLTEAVAAGPEVRFPMRVRGLVGPDQRASANTTNAAAKASFHDAVLDTREFIRTHRRVPSRVFIGAESVSPADFLVTLATAHGRADADVRFPSGTKILTEHNVADDTPGLFGGWVIHKEGFRAPKVVEQGKLQAWTLKPAVRE